LKRFAPPELKSYSEKTDLPLSERRPSVSRVSDGVSPAVAPWMLSCLKSPNRSSISNETQGSVNGSFDAVDFEGGSADILRGGEGEASVAFLDEILSNAKLDVEGCLILLTTAYLASGEGVADHSGVDVDDDREATDIDWWSPELLPMEEILRMEKSGAYQAMAEEISQLLSPEPTALDAEVGNHESCNRDEFMPSEEKTALKLFEAFTCMLSKHIMDVSMSNAETVDYKTWVTESDKLDAHFDDDWKSYLGEYFHTSLGTSSSTSNLLHGTGSNPPQDLPSTNMKELLFRYGFVP